MSEVKKFNSTFEYKLIYVFRINDGSHSGCLKIGDATIHTNKAYSELTPNCHDLNYAARERIDSYTATAGIIYDLLYTEIAVYNINGKIKAFRDHKVHNVLIRSGINRKTFDTDSKGREWFRTDLQTVINAIKAVKEGRMALNESQISNELSPIVFRPEQKEAIKKTITRFKTDNKMLWNAKMRFGKTLSALQVAKQMEFGKTIIITHRPVVSEGWFEDFNKIFFDKKEYHFGSKTKGENITTLLKNNSKFVYFASMQDLRGSDAVGGNFDKNDELFKTNWDFVVVDEAHEGTTTDLGKNVLKAIIKEDNNYKTYVLELSGTPFNLLTNFEPESIYTWDYIMEQEAKIAWDETHFGDSNPYEELPRMNIFTYHLEKSLPVYIDVMDKAFNFREFFRLWTGDIKKDGKPIPKGKEKGDFVHDDHVKQFLDLICKKDDKTNYPYATSEYRDYFRHSLWVVPGVKEAKALSALLKNHPVFRNFEIVNVAGDGDEEIDTSNALKAVKNAMTNNPSETYTITLSCGRLTTGVSVPEWTAVLMLAGTYSTAASQYLQTIFRVQTPANINGKIKEECFVFDFAPDRTLKMVAESVQLSARAGASNPSAEATLSKFLNYCPVISIDQSNMKEYKVAELLQELKKAYAERVARNGFDDPKIYNDELLKLTEVELKEFEDLKKIVGDSKQTKKPGNIDINREGFDEEESEEEKDLIQKKKKQQLSEEELARLAELKEKRKNRDSAISILRAISIRMPMLVYGMDIDIEADVTIDNFADLIDGASWAEFMPKGVTKTIFKKFSKYYDKDIFIAASRRIRFIAKTADELEPTERVMKIASLFATFKNPDKETVLTPWRIVNLHMSGTIGGWDFFDEKHIRELQEPRFINQDGITNKVFDDKSKILEINSKTGLYPLYMTYSFYKEKSTNGLSFKDEIKIWDSIVANQIFVICKTPMAKLITKRTLLGYRKGKANMHAFDDLIMQIKDKPDKFIEKITKKSFWNLGGNGDMKFNAVVGNPPYQEEVAKQQSELNGQTTRINIFHYFQLVSNDITSGVVSLIYPGARWIHRSGKGMAQFGLNQINDKRLQRLDFYPISQEIFSNISIDDGISIVLINKDKENNGFIYGYHSGDTNIIVNVENPGTELLPLNPANSLIIRKVSEFISKYKLNYLYERILPRSLFGIESTFVESNPDKVRIYSKDLNIDYEKEVKLFTNDKSGPAGRSQWYVVNKDLITQGKDYISKWQVVVSSAHPGGQAGRDNQIEIIDNHSVFGRARVALASFDTKEEAENFYKYANTKIVKFMFLMTEEALTSLGKKVPDILDYTSNNELVDFTHDINKQLCDLIGLTDDEIKYIDSILKK